MTRMSKMQEEELITIIQALGEDERRLVIRTLPVPDLLEGLKERYEEMSQKCAYIQEIIN